MIKTRWIRFEPSNPPCSGCAKCSLLTPTSNDPIIFLTKNVLVNFYHMAHINFINKHGSRRSAVRDSDFLTIDSWLSGCLKSSFLLSACMPFTIFIKLTYELFNLIMEALILIYWSIFSIQLLTVKVHLRRGSKVFFGIIMPHGKQTK